MPHSGVSQASSVDRVHFGGRDVAPEDNFASDQCGMLRVPYKGSAAAVTGMLIS
jgi:regulator of RNase E activity RraA